MIFAEGVTNPYKLKKKKNNNINQIITNLNSVSLVINKIYPKLVILLKIELIKIIFKFNNNKTKSKALSLIIITIIMVKMGKFI